MKAASDEPVLSGLAPIVLRDGCACAECRDSSSGQRLRSITDLPAQVSVASASVTRRSVEVIFEPDGHRAVFSRRWLAEQHSPPDDDAPRTLSACGP